MPAKPPADNDAPSPRYWLMKSEPTTFSIDDLRGAPKGTTSWEGVRNFQARNYLRSQRKGDGILFYHSNCAEPGVVGLAKVAREAYPDHHAFDPNHKYHDPKSDPTDPTWFMTDVKFVRKFARVISLHELQRQPALEGMMVIRKGNRLSVTEVNEEHYDYVVKLGSTK